MYSYYSSTVVKFLHMYSRLSVPFFPALQAGTNAANVLDSKILQKQMMLTVDFVYRNGEDSRIYWIAKQ